LALQPAIVAYDTYFGYYAGSIYDESLIGLATHLVYRVWSVGTAVLVVSLVSARWSRSTRDAVLAAVAGALLVALFIGRGEAGLERGRSYVQRALGGHVQTAHFDIYYDAKHF